MTGLEGKNEDGAVREGHSEDVCLSVYLNREEEEGVMRQIGGQVFQAFDFILCVIGSNR